MKTMMATALLGTGLAGADERRSQNGAAFFGIVRATDNRVTVGWNGAVPVFCNVGTGDEKMRSVRPIMRNTNCPGKLIAGGSGCT